MQIYYSRSKSETVTFDEYEYLERLGLVERRRSRLWFTNADALDMLDQYRILNDLYRCMFSSRNTFDSEEVLNGCR